MFRKKKSRQCRPWAEWENIKLEGPQRGLFHWVDVSIYLMHTCAKNFHNRREAAWLTSIMPTNLRLSNRRKDGPRGLSRISAPGLINFVCTLLLNLNCWRALLDILRDSTGKWKNQKNTQLN